MYSGIQHLEERIRITDRTDLCDLPFKFEITVGKSCREFNLTADPVVVLNLMSLRLWRFGTVGSSTREPIEPLLSSCWISVKLETFFELNSGLSQRNHHQLTISKLRGLRRYSVFVIVSWITCSHVEFRCFALFRIGWMQPNQLHSGNWDQKWWNTGHGGTGITRSDNACSLLRSGPAAFYRSRWRLWRHNSRSENWDPTNDPSKPRHSSNRIVFMYSLTSSSTSIRAKLHPFHSDFHFSPSNQNALYVAVYNSVHDLQVTTLLRTELDA